MGIIGPHQGVLLRTLKEIIYGKFLECFQVCINVNKNGNYSCKYRWKQNVDCKNNWEVIIVIVPILNLWLSFLQVYSESFNYRHFTCWILLQWFRLAFFKMIYLLYFWLSWAFTGTCGLSRGYSHCRSPALGCVGFSAWGSKAPERRFSSDGTQAWVALQCEIFLDQGSNPCPLHWLMDSLPLDHQASPRLAFWGAVIY